MSRILLIFSLFTLFAAQCGSEKKATAPTSVSSETRPKTGADGNLTFDENRPDTVQGTRQVAAPPTQHKIDVHSIPKANTSRRGYMGAGQWYAVMAYQASDTTVHKQYLGRFLKFKDDLTFDILQNGQVAGGGEWNFDDEKMLVYLSSPNPYFNNTWKVMEKGFTMVWIGQTAENRTGMQIRWNCQK